MCGRFAVYSSVQAIMEYADVLNVIDNFSASYNVAPGQKIPAIINNGKDNELHKLKWGLVPPWAEDDKIGYRLINTRAETVDTKPSFKKAFQQRRCLIPANGFYEWQKPDKTPYYIKLKDQELFCFAGIWENWKSQEGEEVHSCSIITTVPNQIMQSIHNRMPVIIPTDVQQYWLQGDNSKLLKEMLIPYNSEQMLAYPVSNEVNSYKNNYPELRNEVALMKQMQDEQLLLF